MPCVMIDCHCHILPNIDDGPQEVDESIEMAKIASRDGIEKIIATPHITDNKYPFDDIENRVRGKIPSFIRRPIFPFFSSLLYNGNNTLFWVLELTIMEQY